MIEIGMNNIQKILPLYSRWDHHMSIRAAAEGEATAYVWADSVDSPSTAAMCFGVRLLIGGNPHDRICRDEITHFLHNAVLQNQIERMRHYMNVFWAEPDWKEVLLQALCEYNPVVRKRQYFGLDTTENTRSPVLPGGYELRYLSKSFLQEREWKNKRALRYEMCSERINVDDFLKHSFGVCAICDNEIVGWCLSEYNNSKGCEVGIEVVEEHQQKGIGTALTLALIEEARKRGLQKVGWSCSKDNIKSSATARKAGFVKLAEYETIVVER